MDVESYFEAFTARNWETPATDEQIRFAVVGCGWFAEEFALPAIEQGEHCTASVLVTGDAEKGGRIADDVGAAHVLDYAEYQDGAAAEAYDAVYVSTPNALHLEHVETAAALGKDVLCEKPLEVSADRTERMVAACADADVTLMTAYRQQAEPGIRRMREVIADGVIGTPVYAIGDFSITLLGRDADADQWRLDPDLAGGGALVDIGIYPVNTLRYLIDEDPIAVQAETKTSDERYAGVEEHISFQLSFPGRMSAAVASSYGAALEDTLVIVGTEGKLEIDPAFFPEAQRTFHLTRDGATLTLEGSDVSGIDEEFEYFASCVLTGTDPDPDGHDGLTDVRTIEAIYEAADTGSRVEL
jgi:xylose dehydrogenase (NAD/NADP)